MIETSGQTRLLVSVRSADEAKTAWEAGADLIDVKEPDRGALGAADPESIREVLIAVDGRRPVSAALGELLDLEDGVGDIPRGLALAKIGLSGCQARDDWRSLWQASIARFPEGTASVGVVYADWQRAAAPEPERVLDAAIELGCQAILIDTFDKSGGTLLDVWPADQLARFAQRVRSGRQWLVLGGSLSQANLAEVLPLSPDFVAVRTAACCGGRQGKIDDQRVRGLRKLIVDSNVKNSGSNMEISQSSGS